MRHATAYRLVLILLFVLPLVALFLMPGHLLYLSQWFWLGLLLSVLAIWLVLGVPPEERAGHAASAAAVVPVPPGGPRMLMPEELPSVVRQVMDVQSAFEQAGVQAYRGRLKETPERAYEQLKQAAGTETVPLVQEDVDGVAVVLVPRRVEQQILERPIRWWLHWLLFLLTFITTTFAGAAYVGINLLEEPMRFTAGLPYSISLLAILGVHELGHYFTAKHHGMNVTPPFFIPVPFALGTFGAFIQMRSPPEDRKALFDVAVAGPLAGLAVAIPALLIGLRLSQVVPDAVATGTPSPTSFIGTNGAAVNSSIMLALLAKLALGDAMHFGSVLRLHPAAFAGWIGLLITALNLLPIGQLDGGHTARAMFGTRIGRTISATAMWTLFLLALFVWPGLFTWALIVFFLAGRGTPPLNDVASIGRGRLAVGYLSFLILALILSPIPRALCERAGIMCPYL
ncbi:MAG TPA: site-2 protease family protein [Tepidisphaeraceae bacterium]